MADRNKKICSNAVLSFMRLPVELQTEIFLRLPLTSLSTCKRVCRSFRTLIRNPDFQRNHKNTSHSLLLQFKREISSKMHHTSHVLVSIDNTTKDVISNTSLVPQIPYVGVLFLIGSCNGLVCFAVRTENEYYDDILLLWNPVTEQSKYIPIPNIYGYLHQKTLEFYFVPETNDYNILSIWFTRDKRDDLQVAVYRVSTNSWEIVDDIRLGEWFNYYATNPTEYSNRERATSVFLNGSFHWVFTSVDSSEIVSFNVKDEKLGWIRRIDGWEILHTYDVGIIDESLALISWSRNRKDIEIEVMNDDGVQDSWVLKRILGPNNVNPNGCWNNSVMTSDQHSVYFYDTNDGKMMKKLISLPENYSLSGFSSFSLPWLQ